MPLNDYEVMVVSRTPNATGGIGPTLTELGPIKPKDRLSWSRELWFDGGEINLSVDPDEVPANIAERLLDPFMKPSELRLYKGGTLIQQGPIISVQVQGPTVTIQCHGVMYYTRYMHITSNLSYTNTDQYTVVKNLIDHHQNKTYGHFGIDASGVGTSGTTVTREYKANRLHNVFTEIDRLAQRQTGFDYYITIDANRDLVLTGNKGTDKSASVILDSRVIWSPQISMSASSREVGSQVLCVGHSFTNDPVTGDEEDATALTAFGRAQHAQHFDTVPTQTEIDSIADAMLEAHAQVKFNPGAFSMIPVVGAKPIDDFDAGDTVSWIFDAGLGVQNVQRDVTKVRVTIDHDGQETMDVEFH